MQPSPSYTKIPQENIRGMLALFKAKATDQRFKFINIAKLTSYSIVAKKYTFWFIDSVKKEITID